MPAQGEDLIKKDDVTVIEPRLCVSVSIAVVCRPLFLDARRFTRTCCQVERENVEKLPAKPTKPRQSSLRANPLAFAHLRNTYEMPAKPTKPVKVIPFVPPCSGTYTLTHF